MTSPSLRFCAVTVLAAAGLPAPTFAQSPSTSIFPAESQTQTEPTFILPGARVQSASTTLPGAVHLNFSDDYSTYLPTDYTNVPLSLVPLIGQINPAGFAWAGGANNSWFGAASLATMQAAGAAHPSGVSPAFGPIVNFAAAARSTGGDVYNSITSLLASYQVAPLAPAVGAPGVVSQDIYLSSIDNQPRTHLWWSPVQFSTSQILDRVFYGGTNLQGSQAFATNAAGILDRFISIGPTPGFTPSAMYASAQHPNFPPPVNQWFTLMAHFSADAGGTLGYSLWIKTQDTITSIPPFIDPRLASGVIPASDMNPVGWINIYPGFPDNPATPAIIEGIGLGADVTGVPSPNTGPFGQSPPLGATAFDGIQYGTGLDDPTNPAFAPDDYFFANFRIGVFIPCPADLNGDGVVNSADLAVLLANWGAIGLPGDLNGDGTVDSADLAILLSSWGLCDMT